MQIRTFIVDAFTDKPFSGNPASVCILEKEIDEKTMQSIASELGISMTAFIIQKENAHQFDIKYFNPIMEIDFCGHATIASSKIILDIYQRDKVEFITRKGTSILAKKQRDLIKMNFPLYSLSPCKQNSELFNSFGISNPISFGLCKELGLILVEVKDKQLLLDINPNFQMALESSKNINAVAITTKSEDEEYDFYSRCFCPWLGNNEDHVTGASHSVLANYWAQKLKKNKLSAYQLSNRGGFMKLEIVDEKTLEVISNAKITLEGEFKVR